MQETHKKHTLHKTKKHIKENTRKEEMQNYIPTRNDELKQTLTLVSPDPRLRKMAELDVPAVTPTFTDQAAILETQAGHGVGL